MQQDGTRAWMNENDERHCIKIGSSIRFSVKSFQENEEIVDLTGALLGPQTGCVEWLALQSEEKHEAESTQMLLENGVKKSKHKESRSAEVDAEVSEGISEHTPKKKKKRKEKTVTGDHSSVKKRRKSLDVSAL